MSDQSVSATDPWSILRRHTAARIGLGRAGAGIPTGETLRFKLAHAQARDAVCAGLDTDRLAEELRPISEVHLLHSAAKDRAEYLRRPDLGRQLDDPSPKILRELPSSKPDLVIVIADGLSALAIDLNAAPFLRAFLPLADRWTISPLFIVQQGRVAIGDEIGYLLGAKSVVVLIGERPGLSSPDSLGVYLTFAPQPGITDERRNCISNIRKAGLSHQAGAEKLAWLLERAFAMKISGVTLKDEMPLPANPGFLST